MHIVHADAFVRRGEARHTFSIFNINCRPLRSCFQCECAAAFLIDSTQRLPLKCLCVVLDIRVKLATS